MGDAIARGVVTNEFVTSSPATQGITSGKITGPPGEVTPTPPAGQDSLDYSRCEFENNPAGVSGGIWIDTWWSRDGTRVFTMRDSSNRLEQHDVSPAFGIEPGNWTNYTFLGFTDPRWILWSQDGTKCYFQNGAGTISERDASTPYDINSLSGTNSKFIGSGKLDAYMSADGTRLWVYSSSSPANSVVEYSIATPFDITTLNVTPVRTKSLVADITNANSIAFSDDGFELYLITPTLGGSAGQVSSYTLSTAFDIDTAGPFTQGPPIEPTAAMSIPRGLFWRPTDGALFVNGDQGAGQQKVQWFCPSTAANIDQFTFNGEKNVAGGNVDSQEGLWCDPTGERIYTCRGSIAVNDVFHFGMSPAHDISTLAFVDDNNADGQSPRGIALSEAGDDLYIYWRNPTNPDGVFRWPLSTSWDIDTKGSRTTLSADFSNAPQGLWFKPDGSEVYLIDNIDNTIYQYNLPNVWTWTGATQTNSYDYSSEFTSASDLTFSSDGTRMYVMNNTDDEVAQYNLGVPWDISTARYSGSALSLPGGSGGVEPRGVAIRDDYLYVCYLDNEFIEQFKAP